MAGRYNSNKKIRGDVGKGLSRCAALDREMDLSRRRAAKYTPLEYNGVPILGWGAMPTQERNRFLSGEGNWEVIQ